MSDAPLPGVDTSFVWPDSPSVPFEILAARGTPGAGKGRQGLMFRRHDVVGLAIAFDDPASSKDLRMAGAARDVEGKTIPDSLIPCFGIFALTNDYIDTIIFLVQCLARALYTIADHGYCFIF